MGLWLVFGVLGAIWALKSAARLNPSQARKFGQQILGYGLIVVAAFMAFRGNFAFSLPLAGFAAALLGWQKFTQPKPVPPQSSSTMSKAEALEILGLKPDAVEDDIRTAHRRLQKANHPDAGGTGYLATKINQARDILLKT